nr:hypothetical protein [Kitasatospora indigofera]
MALETRTGGTVVAAPVAHDPPLSAREEGRVVHDELPVGEMAAGAGHREITKLIADDDQDLHDVLADQLHDERDDPRVHGADDLRQVALPDHPVVVP